MSLVRAGRPAGVRQLTSRTTNARMGLRSSVPPMGGMMPRNRFRYGSHSVLRDHSTP